MENLFTSVEQWFSVDVLINLTIVSIISFIASLVIIPIILIRLPSDYFNSCTPHRWMTKHHPILRTIGIIVKNSLGVIFIIAGFIMLFLPGQGILTILIGISFMDFPNKRKLEIKIIQQPVILKTINTMRQKHNRPPLTLP